MLDETTMNVQATQQDLDKMKTQVNAFRAKVRSILTSQLRLLDEMVIEEGNTEGVAEEAVKPTEMVNGVEEVKGEED